MEKRSGATIIIPNYNYGEYIGAAIESTLAQDYPTVEIIVVDDGSTDDSREVIRTYGARIVSLFEKNRGQLEACRSGLLRASNDIIMFLDSDDMLVRNAVSVVASHWRDGISKVQFALSTVDRRGIPVGNRYPKYPKGMTPKNVRRSLLNTGCYLSPPTSGNACSRGFLERVLLNGEQLSREMWVDTVFVTLAPLYGEVVTLDHVLGYYRSHGRNDSEVTAITQRRFERAARKEVERMTLLRTHCEHLGIALAPTLLSNNAAYSQFVLAAEKLSSRNEQSTFWKRVAVGRDAVVSTWRSSFGFRTRLLLAAWTLMVGISPRSIAKRLLTKRYVVETRNRWIKKVITLIVRPVGDEAGEST